ncbi:sortase [Conexibacter sp. DBS9H8]|uniref:sortase n=1 Tax=Conexibacter sp. DBS9H8 TaxID=2937801 RepID=UPI00200C0F11|nr:class E sortase [Conexibacter sp. DBS9H8]
MTARSHRGWRLLSLALILAGGALGADVLATALWQEPVTAVIATIRRAGLNERFSGTLSLSRVSMATLATIHSMDSRIAFLAAREARTAPDGAVIGRLVIPRIGAADDLIQGADAASLELGPGHYGQTPLPGEGGTVAIAGHRTTYLAPFRDINELSPGDPVVLYMGYGTFTYTVTHSAVVAPNAWWITRPVGHEQLVLSSCNPLFSAAQRLVVFARLVAIAPAGPARLPSPDPVQSIGRGVQLPPVDADRHI